MFFHQPVLNISKYTLMNLNFPDGEKKKTPKIKVSVKFSQSAILPRILVIPDREVDLQSDKEFPQLPRCKVL